MKAKERIQFRWSMVLLITVMFIYMVLTSCEKEEPKPTQAEPPKCDCFEEHQTFVDGFGWQLEYTTDTIQRNCSDDNNSYIWKNPEHTKRYIVNCN